MGYHKQMGDYLKGLAKRKGEFRKAKVVRLLDDGSYECVLDDTGGTVRADAGSNVVNLVPLQQVVLSSLEASGRAIGGGWVVVSYPRVSVGLGAPVSGTTALAGESVSRIMVAGVEVSSVILVVAGAVVTILIYGTGLTSAPTYGHASIVNHAAQVITATLITLQVKANAGTPLGRYTLTVAGVVIPNFFAVNS